MYFFSDFRECFARVWPACHSRGSRWAAYQASVRFDGATVITPSKHRYAKLALAFALALFASADSAYWERCTPQPRAIFSGITYGCELLERTEEGHGILHWVRVEL